MIPREEATRRDRDDPLRHRRDAFDLPPGRIYLDGNSLGALPAAVPQRLQRVVREQWGNDLVHSWNRHRWIDLPHLVGDRIARLVGATAGQVVCADSISVNLFKLLAASLALRPRRRVVLSVSGNFPTDLYMVQGLRDLVGRERCDLRLVAERDLPGSIDEEVAVVLLSQVNFRSGRLLPMAEISAAAHAAGALTIWDLAHSAGVLPVTLDECRADFAVGCGYKYLNGGPGAPGFLYAAHRHHADLRQPLSGWMGHRAPFAFAGDYEAAEGVGRFLSGTPPILSMAALDAALDSFEDVTIEELRRKSMALGDFFVGTVKQAGLAGSLRLASPDRPEERGSQLSWAHPEAYGICRALAERGIIADFREPDLLRVGFAPLYNRFDDLWQAVDHLRAVLAAGEHMDERWRERPTVT
jgi:kynureninase